MTVSFIGGGNQFFVFSFEIIKIYFTKPEIPTFIFVLFYEDSYNIIFCIYFFL